MVTGCACDEGGGDITGCACVLGPRHRQLTPLERREISRLVLRPPAGMIFVGGSASWRLEYGRRPDREPTAGSRS